VQSPRALLQRFAGLEVLVVGEAFLDSWVSGPSPRLAREAPVPVVAVESTVSAPGAAANTAANAAALGARVRFLSVVGDDADGAALRRALRERGVPDDDVLAVPGRRTVSKRRVLAGEQMLLRVDDGDTQPPARDVVAALLLRLDALVERCDVVVVGDYDAGLFVPEVLDGLTAVQERSPRLLVVDARTPLRWSRVRPAAVKPNAAEVTSLLDETGSARLAAARGEDRVDAVAGSAGQVLDAAGASVVAVTLDADGAVLLERDRPPHRLYTTPAPPTRSNGAGDSFTAAFALALGAGADASSAAELGAAAATVVVQSAGTTVCSAAELRSAVTTDATDLLDAVALADAIAAHRAAGRRVVFTNGCFDVLHRGHVAYLNAAKEQGDVLVVGLNSDASVARLKGEGRPVNPVGDRAAVLRALSCVDHLAVFDGDTAADLLEVVRPDVYVKGGDYTAAMLPEAPLVERLGGEVRILDYLEDRSTSGLLARIRGGARAEDRA
jgi:D-beta-D-heptose 7-phosphate kinase / D-beta-D-heptose 1-phosphate adenosyltransferase